MKKMCIILFMIIAPFVSNAQFCNGVTLLELDYIYPYNNARFTHHFNCCGQNGYWYFQDVVIDYGDGTTGNDWSDHYYNIPGTYYVTGSFYCNLDSTTYYIDTFAVVIGCPSAANQSYWQWMPHYYTDSIVGELDWNFWEDMPIIIDSIVWGDGLSTNFEDTILPLGWPTGSFYHNYGTSLDTSYTFNVLYRYLYDSSCTYNFSFHFDFPCNPVQNNGVTVYQSDKYRARFYCVNPNSTKYYEWYITEYGDSVYGNGNHIVYFPDTGYVHYCKYRQSLIDSSCFSFVCDSVYINDTIWGCTDPLADNYNPQANTSDPSACLYSGCMDPIAFNYDPAANVSDSSSCMYAHNVVLHQGWSIVSSYRQPINSSIEEMFSETQGYHGLVVKNGLGQVYYPNYGVNQIDSVRPGEGFQVYIVYWFSNPVVGEIIIPEQTPIALPQGWSILGYPRISNGLLDSMLVDIIPNLTIMKNDEGGVYWTQFGINQIDSLEVGKGYQIKMSQSDTLFYPAN